MDSLVASPVWTEHFTFEVGEIQPPFLSADFQTPLDLYLHVRELVSLDIPYLIAHPWLRTYAPLQVLQYLSGSSKEPFIAVLEKPLPIAISCQLALLWAIAGFPEQASNLAASLLPLIRADFPFMWSHERDYDEKEAKLSFALLLLALDRSVEANQLYEANLPKDLFFAWLFEKNVKIASCEQNSEDYDLIEGQNCTYALTLNQNRIQSGALRSGAIVIPAFGLHSSPLSNSSLFGMKQIESKEGWFSSAIAKDAWFRLTPIEKDALSLQCIGVEPENPVYFVFYVRAGDCFVGGRQFKPKSLLRFSGEVSEVVFQQGTDRFNITTDLPLSVEMIPLSGGGSFWGAAFLLAFRVPSVVGKVIFQMSR